MDLTRCKIIVILVLFISMLIPFNAFSDNQMNWAVLGGLFYFPADNGVDSDPAPVIPTAGFSMAWQLKRFLKIEATEDLYFTNYEYNANLGYPMACNPENRSAFVMGLLTGVQAVGFFPIGENIKARIYGGPAFDFRIITLAFGLNKPSAITGVIQTDPRLQTDEIIKYFWGKGRWLMPVAGFGFDFPLNEKFYLGFDIRTWFPVYKLWVKDNSPAIDGWRFGVGLRITGR